MNKQEVELLIGVGSQGTAALAIIDKLLRALIAKGALAKIEVHAILDPAAEGAEHSPDKLGGNFSKSVGVHIRQMIEAIAASPEPSRH